MPTKVHLVKAMVFPVVMYGLESWAIRKAEYWRIDAFELQFWRRLLRVPWTARRSNQSILKEISLEYSLERLMLKLKLQYSGHKVKNFTDAKNWLLGKDLDAGKDWRQEEKGMKKRDGWMASPARWTWVWASSGRWWLTGKPGLLQSRGAQRIGHDWTTELNWICSCSTSLS